MHLCEAAKLTENAEKVHCMAHCFIALPAKQVCGGHSKECVSPRSVERRVKSFDATGNASPKDSRHKFYCKLSKFEELTVLHTLLTSPGTFLHGCTQTWMHTHGQT